MNNKIPSYVEMITENIIEHGLGSLGKNDIAYIKTEGKTFETPHIIGGNENLMIVECVDREFVGFDINVPEYAPVVNRYVIPLSQIKYIKLRREAK